MAYLKPTSQLGTHDVTNQPPPFEEVNLYDLNTPLKEAVVRDGGAWAEDKFQSFGARMGSAEVGEWATLANTHIPALKNFDRYGHRIDEAEFHPAYHALMDLGLGSECSSIAWTAPKGGHVAHVVLEHMMGMIEPGCPCPITMTYAAVPALRHQPDLAALWEPLITSAKYDASSRPALEKAGVTIGMAMTEKQGGSDVRANTTKAEPEGMAGPGQAYRLNGHKWFCSAPMCDAFLTLAYVGEKRDAGLSCFLVPRWRPDGTRNAGFQIMRLKDKLGDRSNASSEIEYHNAYGTLLGEEGHGLNVIMEMVQHTRLDTVAGPVGYMRHALAHAIWHTHHRTAFQKRLIDQPLMEGVLADLTLDSEAATALMTRVARSFDERATNPVEAAFARLATPIAKYWHNKRVVPFVHEAMECHGGAGYVEESILPRLYRQAPLNGIWEGSGNVICLDVLRAASRHPESVEAILAELTTAKGGDAHYDQALSEIETSLKSGTLAEHDARRFTERLALLLQASLLIRHAPNFVSDAFSSARLGPEIRLSYGPLSDATHARDIINRALAI
jgi:putative acyl-CoA dehydrogenase